MSTATKKITAEKAKDAGLALVLLSLLLYRVFKIGFLFPLALVVLIFTMTYPAVFRVWARIWFGLSDFLGKYISMALMGIAFFCVVTPIGVVRKVLGKDSLMLKEWKKGSGSIMTERNHLFTKKDIERPY